MKRCKRCVVPETYAGSNLENDEVCNACRQTDIKNDVVNWDKREKYLKRIFREAKKNTPGKYDCIAPVSFGKDSTFILYTLKKVYGMNPLAVTFNHGWFTEHHKQNIWNVREKLNIDHLMITPDQKVIKKLIKKSIKKLGDVCWHCHAGVGAVPAQVAMKMNIPLIVWGEPGAEFGVGSYHELHTHDHKSFRDEFVKGVTYQDMIGDGLSKKDLELFIFPSKKDLECVGVKSIFLGDYIKWNIGKQVELIKKEVGWKGNSVEGSFDDSDNVECKYVGVHDYECYLKRGFGRATHLAGIAIREGRMTKEEGMALVRKYDGKKPKSLKSFLKQIKMTETDFIKYHEKHKVKK